MLDSISFNLDNGVDGNGPYLNIMGLSGVFTGGASQSLGNDVTVSADSTIDSQNAGTTTFGALTIGANMLTLTNSVNPAAVYGVTFGATSLGGNATFNVATSGGTLTLGSLTESSAGYGIVKSGPGTLVLASPNSFTGNVTVTGGTLRLADGSTNNIAGSPIVALAGGTTLDVSGLASGTLALGAGSISQTLKATGTGAVALAGGVIVPAGSTLGGTNGASLAVSGGVTLEDGSHSAFTLGDPANGAGNPPTAMIDVTAGGLNVSGTNTVDLSGSTQVGDVYELYAFTGAPPAANQFVIGNNSAGNFNYSISVTGSEVDLNVLTAATSAAWDFNGNGNYGDATKWNPMEIPNGAGLVATFGNGVTTTIDAMPSLTVTINGNQTAGSLVFDNSHGTNYILASGGFGTGLTLDNLGNGATITVNGSGVANPTTTIYADLTLADNTTINVAAGNALVLSSSGGPAALGESGGSHSLGKTGAGSLTIDRSGTYTGGTFVTNGAVTVSASGAIGSGPLEVDGASGNASSITFLNMSVPQSVAGLTGTVSGGTARVSVTNGATLSVNQASGTATFAGTLALGSGAGVNTGGTLTKSGSGSQVLTAPPQLGNGAVLNVSDGTLKVAAGSGTVSVGTNVTANISGTGTLELAGSLSALGTSTAGQRVAIYDTSTAPVGILVSGGNQQVGAISGTGNIQLAPPSGQSVSLTADHIKAGDLVIGGDATSSAILSIAPSDTFGNPTDASSFAVAGSLTSGAATIDATASASLLAAGGSPASGGSSLGGSALAGSSVGGAAAVPEPSTLLLLILGSLAALLPVCRRAKSRLS